MPYYVAVLTTSATALDNPPPPSDWRSWKTASKTSTARATANTTTTPSTDRTFEYVHPDDQPLPAETQRSRRRKQQRNWIAEGIICCLLCCILLLLAVVITLAVLYIVASQQRSNDLKSTSSLSQQPSASGVAAATRLLTAGLDTRVDPCDDFYSFACGNWSNSHLTPAGKSYNDELSVQQEKVVDQLYTAFRLLNTNQTLLRAQPPAVRTASHVFESCVNVVGAGAVGSGRNPLLHTMQTSQTGVWPLLVTDWQPYDMPLSVSGLAGLLAGLLNVNTFLTPSVGVDWANVSRHSLFVGQASLSLGTINAYNNLSSPVMQVYRDTIRAAAEVLANDANTPLPVDVDSQVLDIVRFEQRLAAGMSEPDYAAGYRVRPAYSLKTSHPGLDWDQYWTQLLPTDVYARAFPLAQVIVVSDDYLSALNRLLQQTPPRTLYNYLLWRLVHARLWVLSPSFRSINNRLKATRLQESLGLRYAASSHSVECIDVTTKYMGYAVGRLYIEQSLNGSHPNMSHVIGGVREAYKTLIMKSTWLDRVSALRALQKIDALLINTAYPPWIMDDTKLDVFYRNLTIVTNQSFYTTLNRLAYWTQTEQAYRLLRSANRSAYFGGSPALVNAWYSAEHNALTLPAGLIQPPLARADYPLAVQFGGFGSVVGHELMHAFDDQGIHFGPQGQMGTWLDAASWRGFNAMSQCLVDDYSSYCYADLQLCVDGQMTKGENMADIGGLESSFAAFKRATVDRPLPPPMPADLAGFTPDQLFFLSYASTWCSAGGNQPAVNRQFILYNPHPPDQVRVIGSLRNFPAFARAYNCPVPSPMAAEKPCNVF